MQVLNRLLVHDINLQKGRLDGAKINTSFYVLCIPKHHLNRAGDSHHVCNYFKEAVHS